MEDRLTGALRDAVQRVADAAETLGRVRAERRALYGYGVAVALAGEGAVPVDLAPAERAAVDAAVADLRGVHLALVCAVVASHADDRMAVPACPA